MEELSFKTIWRNLAGIDVSGHVRQKGELNYLPWSHAWSVLMEEYPEADYKFKEPRFFEDGSCEVWCSLSIGTCKRKMWLPVMDFKGQPVKHPDAKLISNTRMRALVKCMAMFGLGVYIYKAEELPELRGRTTGELLDFEKVLTAYKFFKAKIDEDRDEPNYQAMQDAEANLNAMNQDYIIEVMNMFGKTKPEKATRQYKNILADCLKIQLDENGKPLEAA